MAQKFTFVYDGNRHEAVPVTYTPPGKAECVAWVITDIDRGCFIGRFSDHGMGWCYTQAEVIAEFDRLQKDKGFC